MSSKKRLILPFLLAGLLCGAASALHADDNDPPSRVARLAYLQGGVSLRPAGADDWVEAGLNRPLTIGDQLWSDRGGRIEMQLDGSNLRLGSETSAGILNLSDDATQIQLSSGTLIVHVRDLADNESYEIDTPNVAFSILRPGTYRLDVDENGGSTAIAVRSGQGEAVGGNGTGYTLRAGEYDTFAGVEQIAANTGTLGPQDEFDAWSAERDGRFDHSQSAQYVSNDVVGYEELDNQGDWDDTPDYGHVWFPSGVQAGWAPYQQGHWAYVAPWGYTWIDDRPWGFAPFHYGRWVYWRQRWGWVPAPPPAPRAVYVRPVYAPALVAWVGSGATVAWFPLAPREVYVPSYPVSRRYLNVINVSNTQVNTTIINNVYNTTIVNRTTINNVTYANRRVPGAIMASSTQDFASARPMRRDGGARAFADAPVRAFAPPVVPTRAAVYGGRGPTERQPSQAVQTRVTAARMAPAATPSSLDARLQSPRSAGANRVQPPVAAATPRVRVVPPVRTLVSSRDIDNSRLQTAPAAAPPAGSTRPPAHAAEIPTAPRAPSPAGANSVLERQQSQEQQQLQSRQDLERARVQQQQDQQHKRLADGQALDAQRQVQSQAVAELARRQQLDQQRQDQQHNAQLGQLQAQQREQQQAQAQAEQHRAAQQDRQRELDQQVQRQRNAQLQAQQAQQAQAQAEVQKNQALERQRESAQLQSQRQQQALDAQVQTRERQMEQQHLQQTQQLQQQQNRAREELQERQQAAQRQQEQQRRPNPPQPQNPRQPR